VGYDGFPQFVAPSGFGGSEVLDRDIPEPASIFRLGVAGASALLARRRKTRGM
jgi:hypothetical protein